MSPGCSRLEVGVMEIALEAIEKRAIKNVQAGLAQVREVVKCSIQGLRR